MRLTMMEPPTLNELRERIDKEGRRGLLAMPLAELRLALPEAEVGNILVYVGDHLGLRTLGDFLDSSEAKTTLEGALRRENHRWVLATLDAWMSQGGHSPTRFVPPGLPVLPDPGRTAEEIEAFARANDVGDLLAAPARRLTPFFGGDPELMRGVTDALATVGDYLHRERLPEGMPRRSTVALRLSEAAKTFLLHSARVRLAEAAEQARWQVRPTSPRLRMLAARLREARLAVVASPAGDEPLLDEPIGVTLEDEPPRVEARFRAPKAAGARAESTAVLVLSGFEAAPPRASCTCVTAQGGGAACPHIRAVLGFAIDAAHDEEHTLHEALVRLAEVPTWTRFLDVALRVSAADQPERAEVVERLVFRLERSGDGPLLRPALQRRRKSGGYTAGSLTTFERVASRDELLTPEDRPIVDALLALEGARGGRTTEKGRSAREAMALRALIGHPRLFAADDPETAIRVESARLVVALSPAEGGVRVEFRLRGEVLDSRTLLDASAVIRHDLETTRSYVAEVPAKLRPLLEASTSYPAVLPEVAQDRLLSLLPSLQPEVELGIPTSLRGREVDADRAVVVRLEPLDSEGLRVSLRVRPMPGAPSWPAGDGPELAMGAIDGERAYARRDREEELSRAEAMRTRLGLHDVHAEGPFTYRLDELSEALATLELVRSAGDAVRVEWPEGVRPYDLRRAASVGDLKVRVRRADAWFGLEGGVELDGVLVPLALLLEAARKKTRFVEIAPRTFARLEKELAAKLDALSDVVFRSERNLSIGAAATTALTEILDESAIEGDADFEALRKRLSVAELGDETIPAGLKAELRPYQADGIRWLSRLSRWGTGAVLADEMGLGKTIQALGLLLSRSDEGPALIVAPTSVTTNWVDEAARFAPDLRVHLFHGAKRDAQIEGLTAGDVVVTSYDVLTRDIEMLRAIGFATLILDEAQAVKNARTRRARAAQRLEAHARIALTGTPLENHLGELYSLFHIVSPGLLGTPEHFRARFSGPIERDGDVERRTRLVELLRPFLLRRTKSEVALDLPARTEVTRAVELSEAERRLYDATRTSALVELEGRSGPEREKRFAVLAALTRLRLLACHPRLADPTSTIPSSKLDGFESLVRDLRNEGHRALVFSQFTSHLGLVQERLDALGIPFLYLDGKTPTHERRKLVQRFQEGDDPLFLISLRAGGTGLNLTAADYVIHLDPWWNPAVEDQASDRAHRIGQLRPVTVVRFVAQGTIEETVMALHAQKRELLDDLLEGGDAAGKASAEELLALLRTSTVMDTSALE